MNSYYHLPNLENENNIDYRSWVGGMWEEIGSLQKKFLIEQGLEKNFKFLDLGCGCLRGGVKIIDYLEKYNYYGQDINSYLLKMGIEKEIPKYNLKEKILKNNFCISEDFTLDYIENIFDMGISQSVFTHLPLNHLFVCLINVSKHFKPKSKFFITFWIVPENFNNTKKFYHKGNISTSFLNDPYHYKESQIKFIANHRDIKYLWEYEYIGNWNHPRDQKIVCFTKKNSQLIEREHQSFQICSSKKSIYKNLNYS